MRCLRLVCCLIYLASLSYSQTINPGIRLNVTESGFSSIKKLADPTLRRFLSKPIQLPDIEEERDDLAAIVSNISITEVSFSDFNLTLLDGVGVSVRL